MKCVARVFAVAVFLAAAVPVVAAELRREHVSVSYNKISTAYAEAIARIVETARAFAIGQFGFNMPETIAVAVTVRQNARPQLWTDGRDGIFLTIGSEADLLRPSKSHVFQIYGMCHEVGHIAMYRLIRNPSVLSANVAEGWAHYFGSRAVDIVYAQQGASLWPDQYDYSADGTKRLVEQLASGTGDGVVQGAAMWKQLDEIVGDRGIAPIFASSNPMQSIRSASQRTRTKEKTVMPGTSNKSFSVVGGASPSLQSPNSVMRGTSNKSFSVVGGTLPSLQSPNSVASDLDDESAKHLEQLRGLKELRLTNAKLSYLGPKYLQALAELETLRLGGTKVSDAGMVSVGRLNRLRELDLDGTRITDAGLEHLKSLNELRVLSLRGTNVTDAGLERLGGLKQLETLQLDGTKVTDVGMKYLKSLTHLKVLHVARTQVTAAGVQDLKKSLLNLKVVR